MREYFDAVRAWDAVHRIIGKSPIEKLAAESEEALGEMSERANCLVDVGAGAGILGIPWLFSRPERSACFVEPDPKKTAFLHQYLSSEARFHGRYLVLTARLEDVSRETVASFSQDFFLALRAFSGRLSAEATLASSAFAADPTYFFVMDGNSAKLKKYEPSALRNV